MCVCVCVCCSWVFWGDNVGEVVVVGDLNPKLAAVWVKDGKVNGVFLEGGSGDQQQVAKAAALKQPAFDAGQLSAVDGVDSLIALLHAA